jgi:hypothetical protein
MVDLSKLTDEELDAIAKGNMASLSDETLALIAGAVDKDSQPSPSQAKRPEQNYLVTGTGRGMSPAAISMFPGEAIGFAPPEPTEAEKKQAVANIVRYGVPVAATVAAAPAVGLGLGGLAALSTIGSFSSYLSEIGAQEIEGGDVSQRAAISAAISGATPYLPYGGKIARPAYNIISALLFSEGARGVADGKNYIANLPKTSGEAFKRWGLVSGLGAISGYAGAASSKAEESNLRKTNLQTERKIKDKFGVTLEQRSELENQIDKVRESGSASGKSLDEVNADVNLVVDTYGITNNIPLQNLKKSLQEPYFSGLGFTASEIVPGTTDLERSVLAQNNAKARKLLDSMGGGIPDNIAVLYPEAQTNRPVRDWVRSRQQELNTARANVEVAKRELDAANKAVIELDVSGSTAAYNKAKAEAENKALQYASAKVIEDYTGKTILGYNVFNTSDINFTARVNAVNEMLDSAESAFKSGLNAAYESAGIGPNQPVLTRSSVMASIRSRSRPGGVFEGTISRKDAWTEVNKFFEQYGTAINDGKDYVITLEGLQRAQGEISKSLESRYAPGLAKRQSAELYELMRKDSDDYLQNTIPEKFAAYDQARGFAREGFVIADTDAIKMLKGGDVDGFYNAFTKEGNGETLTAILNYANLLERSGQTNAARALVSNMNEAVARGVIQKASSAGLAGGVDEVARIIDPSVMARELDKLRQAGFPVQQLGLGTVKQIKAAARLASAGQARGLSTKDLQEFFELSSELGTEKALAKMSYYNAVRDAQIANGTRQQRLAAYKTREAAKRAKVTSEDQIRALERLNDDPLIRLLNDPDFKVPVSGTNSAKFNTALMSLEPSTAQAFAEAMELSGRGADLQNLRKGLLYGLLNKRNTMPDGTQVLDMNGIVNFFTKSDPKLDIQRKAFRAIVGDDAYNEAMKNVVGPLQRIQSTRQVLIKDEGGFYAPNLLVRGKPRTQGPISTTVIGSANDITSLIQNFRYSLLYTLYVNPATSRLWLALTRSGKPLASQPALATAIKLAEQEDMDSRQRNPQ